MRTTTFSLIAIMIIASTIQGMARQRVQIEAVNNDISYYLDLKAVASIFGDSRDLEDFERRINDYDSRISNLDLNSDGDVDYLRVIETSEDNTHLVVIQAILDRDVYQDVATIVVERDRYRRSYVQVIGDPYIYGQNYIIEPVFHQTPFIVSWFWTPRYRSWNSPYSWGYYPRHYNYRHPMHIDLYLSHIHGCINNSHYYGYNDSWRSNNAYRIHNSISRNDYSVRYPERSYTRRNNETTNRYEMDKRRNSDYVKQAVRSSSDNNRVNTIRNSNDNVYDRSNRQASNSSNTQGARTASQPERKEGYTRESQPARKEGYTRESEPARTEVKRTTPSESRVSTSAASRSSSESVRTARPSSENKSVERSSSVQRNSAPSTKKSEPSRSSSSNSSSRNESGRR